MGNMFLSEDSDDLTGGSGGSPWMWVLILLGLGGIGGAVAYYLGVCGGGEKPKKKKRGIKRAVKESSVVKEQERDPLVNRDLEAPAAPVQTTSQPMQQFVNNQASSSYVAAPQQGFGQMAVAAPRMAGSIVIHPDGSQQVLR